ncbi:MAG: hypothetical protein KGJ90_04945 [Patescibacteria group bacterium]|nr:hypothetical protein [Patescibacteria group bacterium]
MEEKNETDKETDIPKSEFNLALLSLLEALKDYNRALVMFKRQADETCLELMDKLTRELQ